jgi:hypothetical protein
MKSKIAFTAMFLAAVFMTGCGKDDDGTNQSSVLNPEKFKAKITYGTGTESTEIEYDEGKLVTAGNILTDDSDSYLAITATNLDAGMTINFYPPDNHPLKDDVISIMIYTQQLKPWARDKTYTTVYVAQHPYVEEYAVVSYWDGSEERDFLSSNRPESMSSKVKLWREGKLLKGEIAARIGLQSYDNQLIYITIEFELRPEDDGLSD